MKRTLRNSLLMVPVALTLFFVVGCEPQKPSGNPADEINSKMPQQQKNMLLERKKRDGE